MSLHRRDFLRTCAVAAIGISACPGTENAEEQKTPPAQPTAPQVPAFDLSFYGEPDADLQKWGTTTFGNWRTLAESRQLQERNGFGIFLPRQSTPMEIVLRRGCRRCSQAGESPSTPRQSLCGSKNGITFFPYLNIPHPTGSGNSGSTGNCRKCC